MTVTKATLLSDRKTVEVEVNEAFTRNQEYTLTTANFRDADGVAYPASSAKFSWAVEDGVKVALVDGSLVVGETTGLTVTDQDGKAVTGATVALTSSNANIATVSGTTVSTATINAIAAGTADVTATVTLADGVILTNTFKVSVAEAPNVVANQGFTLVDDVTDLTETPQNTVAFTNSAKTTSLFAGESKEVAMFNTVNSDPEEAAYEFDGATVRSLNPIIATASVTGDILTINANAGQTGKASFEVTLADNTKRTISVDVKAVAALKDIKTSVTSVKLSDESAAGSAQEGVNQETVTVSSVDQYGENIEFGPTGKVTVTSNTEGLVIGGTGSNNELAFTTTTAGDDATDAFTITTTKDKVVNGKVEVKYFKNATDAQPVSTKTISVNVVDVDPAATPVALDVISASQIDVNAPYTATVSDTDAIDFGSADVYTLDAKGNRLEEVTATASYAGSDDYVDVTNSVLGFQAVDALTLLTASDTVDVEVTADGIVKVLPIKYMNSASVPASATVTTNPVTVKLAAGDNELTFEELIFGAIDSSQLVEDTDLSEYIAVRKAAKNGGYIYNKSLVTVKDASGKVIPTGVNVYGLNDTATTGNIWADESSVFSSVNFNADFSLANVVKTAGGDVTLSATPALTDTVDAALAGDAVSFTLVIKSIYSASLDANATDNNLLAAPVTVNVTVTK
ncbi:Ig-like domain-containing protein [Metaplanococcus flavidus]|uniref:Ig-like domain-containing protein n=1 Tax=Metaplanococcus flavidus TaxID=569883 RepID=A0ABW3LC16_9BACL